MGIGKGGGIISDEIKKQCNQLFIPKSQTIEQADENLLTEEDINFWNEFGYIVLTNAISKEDCKEARDAIWNYLNMDEFDEATWYNNSSNLQGVMVPLYRHPAIDKNRNSPKIRKAFEQLWGQKGLIVTTDKCGYNPPQKNGHIYRGIGLHWDVSLALPIPFGTQGILYLTDTTADQGALTLIPSFHNKIESWLESLPENTHPRAVDLSSFEKISIAANAGDFIIWIHKLPHSGSPNNANFPRLVQYINWFSPLQKTHEKWI
ncbi:MAG: phytanoyl-CoA dioxygenase family protein [Saprospiraceae bacterium]|nr:phytanoyl-CoA dioxygenase family protein [Saprospiraceae bacterium]